MSQQPADHTHEHTEVPSDLALRVKALESLLVDKGLVDPAALDVLAEDFEVRRRWQRNGHLTRVWVGQPGEGQAYKNRKEIAWEC